MSLKAENLSFSYENGGRHVLTRISLKIEPGERVGLVAPSGYGKTTLCRLLAGYERPEAGTVEIDSIPIENIRVNLAAPGAGDQPALADAPGSQ